MWWLKVTILGEMGDWIELEKLSRSKKSPIGYEVNFLAINFSLAFILFIFFHRFYQFILRLIHLNVQFFHCNSKQAINFNEFICSLLWMYVCNSTT